MCAKKFYVTEVYLKCKEFIVSYTYVNRYFSDESVNRILFILEENMNIPLKFFYSSVFNSKNLQCKSL